MLFLTSVTLLTLDARDFAPVERLKDGVAAVVSPFRGLGDRAFSPIGDAWTAIGENDELEAELERLRGRPRVHFAKSARARGILEGIDWYDFLGDIRIPTEEPE